MSLPVSGEYSETAQPFARIGSTVAPQPIGSTPLIPPLPAAFEAMVLPMFRGDLSAGQSYGLRRLLAETDSFSMDQRAYILATVFHETDRVMEPIAEMGRGAGHPYAPLYYGRGLSQITWAYNYARFGKLLNVNLLKRPELALDWSVALPVLTIGMHNGLFTGRKLDEYFGPASYGNKCNPIDARRIINGTDCAELVASYFSTFRAALRRDILTVAFT